MNTQKRAVICVKWGEKFSPDYVNVLFRAVREHLAPPFRFICMTENPKGLDDAIETIAFPEFRIPRETWRKSCFPKIGALAPGILDDDEIVLQLDLDLFVLRNLAPFFELYAKKPAFYSLREWNGVFYRGLPLSMRPDRGTQGSIYLYRAGDQRPMFEHFNTQTKFVFDNFRSDRQYFPTVAVKPDYLPDSWVLSYKKHCMRYWPVNLILSEKLTPSNAKIMVFHGDPKPSDLFGPEGRRWGTKLKFGWGPVPWVCDYWLRYGGTLPEAN